MPGVEQKTAVASDLDIAVVKPEDKLDGVVEDPSLQDLQLLSDVEVDSERANVTEIDGTALAYIAAEVTTDRTKEFPRSKPYLERALSKAITPDVLQEESEEPNHTLSQELLLSLAVMLQKTDAQAGIRREGSYLGPKIDVLQQKHIRTILVDALAGHQAKDPENQGPIKRNEVWTAFKVLRFLTGNTEVEEVEDRDGEIKWKVAVPASRDMFGPNGLVNEKHVQQARDLLSQKALSELFSCGLLPERVVRQVLKAFPKTVDLTADTDETGSNNRAKIVDTVVRELKDRFDIFHLLHRFDTNNNVTRAGLLLSIDALRICLEFHCQRTDLSNKEKELALAYIQRLTKAGESLDRDGADQTTDALTEVLSDEEVGLTPKQQEILQRKMAEDDVFQCCVNPALESLLNDRKLNDLTGLPRKDRPNMPWLIKAAYPGAVTFKEKEDGALVAFIDRLVKDLPPARLVIDALARFEGLNNANQMVADQPISREKAISHCKTLSRIFTFDEHPNLLKPPDVDEICFSELITHVLRQLEEHGFFKPFEDQLVPASNAFVASAIQAHVLEEVGQLGPDTAEPLLGSLGGDGSFVDLLDLPERAEREGFLIEPSDFDIIKKRSEDRAVFLPQVIERQLSELCPGLDPRIAEELANWGWQVVELLNSGADLGSPSIAVETGLFMIGAGGVGKTRMALLNLQIINELTNGAFEGIIVDTSGMVRAGTVGVSLEDSAGFNLIMRAILKHGFRSTEEAVEFINQGKIRFWLIADEFVNKIVRAPGGKEDDTAASTRLSIQTQALGLLDPKTPLKVQVPMDGIPGYRTELEPKVAFIGTGSLDAVLDALEPLYQHIRENYASIGKEHLRRLNIHTNLLDRVGVANLGKVNVDALNLALMSNVGQLRGVEGVICDTARRNKIFVDGVDIAAEAYEPISRFLQEHVGMQFRALDRLCRLILVKVARAIYEARIDEKKRRELLYEADGQTRLIIPASLVADALSPHMKPKNKYYSK